MRFVLTALLTVSDINFWLNLAQKKHRTGGVFLYLAKLPTQCFTTSKSLSVR